MRKCLSVIGSFCLGIGLSIAMLACADDNQHPTSSPEIHINDFMPTILGLDYDSGGGIKFNYDDNGRLIGAKQDYVSEGYTEVDYDISYSGTTITTVETHTTVYATGKTDTRTSTTKLTVTEEDIENVQAYNLAIYLTEFFN